MTDLKNVHEFFSDVNKENGSNYKIQCLTKYKDNDLLKRILKMTYDRVQYTYGMTLDSLLKYKQLSTKGITNGLTLEEALDTLERISKREETGNKALHTMSNILESLSNEDAEVIQKIIDRDLRINLGTTSINKVHKNLIQKPVYMRCGTYNEKTVRKIKFPALVQLKSDGTYREFTVKGTNVQSLSRSGESYEYPILGEQLKNLPEGVYIGELVVKASEDLFENYLQDYDKIQELREEFSRNPDLIMPREIGNGLINSLNVPHKDVILELWDYIDLEEYSNAGNKIKNKIQYMDRFEAVKKIQSENIRCIDYRIVNNLQEALEYTSNLMQQGYEGSILKNLCGVFRDGTSPDQLKLKLEIQAEMRVTGFTPGTGKNKEYFGAMEFENDEGTIKGRVGVSSMSEKQRNEIWANREDMIGKIIEVQFNDITKNTTSDTYAFSHPRFIEIRNDKNETDTLDRVLEYRRTATEIG